MQTTLDRPKTPTRRRFDVDAYHRMAKTGILSPGDRVELIDGEIVQMAPIGSAHGGKVNRLTNLVARVVADGEVIASIQDPLRLDSFNEPLDPIRDLTAVIGTWHVNLGTLVR